MAKVNETELGDDFSYILRLADSDIDGLRPIAQGLTSINGVGQRSAGQICRMAKIDGNKLGGHLTEEEQDEWSLLRQMNGLAMKSGSKTSNPAPRATLHSTTSRHLPSVTQNWV